MINRILIILISAWAGIVFTGCNPSAETVVLNQEEACLSISLDSLSIGNLSPGIVVKGTLISPDNTWKITETADNTIVFEKQDEWRITQVFGPAEENPAWFQISTQVENLSAAPVPVDYIIPFSSDSISSVLPYERFLSEAQLTWNYTGMWYDPVKRPSYSFAGFSDPYGEAALVIGFDDMSDAVYTLDVDMGKEQINSITAKCHREGIPLDPGETLSISDLVIKPAKSLTSTLKEYGWIVAGNMGRSEQEIMNGWCSWYYYYGTLDYDDLAANMEAIHELGLKDRVRVMQIDAGWYNLTREQELKQWKVRGDWLNDHGFKFPMGMKAVAEEIRAQGFIPGIWTAPFLADQPSAIYHEHPGYFIYRNGKQTIGLDPSNPEVLDHLRTVFHKLANNDGYAYFKIDFLGAGLFEGTRHDPALTTVESFREGMMAIRNTVGEKSYILACGAPLAHCIGIVDGARVGHDIATHWVPDRQFNKENGFGGHGVHIAANQVIFRQWMNRIFWHNDPDGVITRDYEIDRRGKHPPMAQEDAGLWARLTWFAGGMGLYSENIPELHERSPERFKWMAEAVPANPVSPDLVDWYVAPMVSVMKSSGDPVMFGIFNLSEEAAFLEIPAEKLGLPGAWKFRERLSGKIFEGSGDSLKFPEIPAHGGRIWVME
jgi:alpha-galactosidase